MNNKLTELRESIVSGMMILNALDYEVDFTRQLGFKMRVQLVMPLAKRHALMELNIVTDEMAMAEFVVPFEEILYEYAEIVSKLERSNPDLLIVEIPADPDLSELM